MIRVIAGLLLLIASASWAQAKSCIVDLARPYQSPMPNRWDHAQQLLPPAQSLLHVDYRSLQDPPPELGMLLANVANDLSLDAADVLAAGIGEGACAGSDACASTLRDLRRLRRWRGEDMNDAGISWTGSPLARFAQGAFDLRLHCVPELENAITCVAALSASGRHVLSYFVQTDFGSGSISRLLRLPCGGISMSDGGEDPPRFSSSHSFGIGHFWEIPFAAVQLPDEVVASSQLEERGKSYPPAALVDGRFSTAWCEGKKGMGVGEWVELRWKKPAEISAIGLVPGYAKTRDTFYANGRISKMRIIASNGQEHVASFTERPSFQLDKLALAGPITSVRLEIAEVLPGAKFEDTCISEIFLALDAPP